MLFWRCVAMFLPVCLQCFVVSLIFLLCCAIPTPTGPLGEACKPLPPAPFFCAPFCVHFDFVWLPWPLLRIT